MNDPNQLLADPFHNCALRAYFDVWLETGQFPPDSETVRKRAYAYYESELRSNSPKDSSS